MNPLRTGLITTLLEMGAEIERLDERDEGGETVADLRVRASRLTGVDVPAHRAPSMIDEYPVLAVAAAFAEGTTRMRGLHELRVKESDRLAAVAAGLAAAGVPHRDRGRRPHRARACRQGPGRGARSRPISTTASPWPSWSWALPPRNRMTVDDGAMIATSFPSFMPLMRELGATIRTDRDDHRHRRAGRVREGNARQAACGALRPAASRHRPALPGGRPRPPRRRPRPHRRRAGADRRARARPQRFDDERLRGAAMGEAASVVSAYQPVRDALLAFQRQFAAQPGGAVLDGRDIGTVVCPHADVKLFITAAPGGAGPAPLHRASRARRDRRVREDPRRHPPPRRARHEPQHRAPAPGRGRPHPRHHDAGRRRPPSRPRSRSSRRSRR